MFTISTERIQTVLWSQSELDGIHFTEDPDGTTIFHGYGTPWTLHLFLLTLAWTMGPDVEPEQTGFEQIYDTLARLTIDMTHPVPDLLQDPEGYCCKLPNIRISPKGATTS